MSLDFSSDLSPTYLRHIPWPWPHQFAVSPDNILSSPTELDSGCIGWFNLPYHTSPDTPQFFMLALKSFCDICVVAISCADLRLLGVYLDTFASFEWGAVPGYPPPPGYGQPPPQPGRFKGQHEPLTCPL